MNKKIQKINLYTLLNVDKKAYKEDIVKKLI